MSPAPHIFTAPSEPFYKCNPPMVLGESPIYRASDSTLHWVDCLITPPELHILHLDPTTHQPLGPSKRIPLSDSVSVLFFRQSHPKSYICAYYQGIAFLDEDTGKLEVVKEIIPTQERGLRRFNDGGVDAKGRLWLAEIDVRAAAAVDAVASDEGKERVLEELGEPVGRLWRYDPDGTLHLMDRGVVCGNGVGWSPDWKSSECLLLLLYFFLFLFPRRLFFFRGERKTERREKASSSQSPYLLLRYPTDSGEKITPKNNSVLQRLRRKKSLRLQFPSRIRYHLPQTSLNRSKKLTRRRTRWHGDRVSSTSQQIPSPSPFPQSQKTKTSKIDKNQKNYPKAQTEISG